mgnify:CR=1 FL=1
MNRNVIINNLIQKNNYKTYLEIGLDDGRNFNSIKIDKKVSVDPAIGEYVHAKPTHKMTSDEFFKNNKDKFDIIFIDGLHESDQVYKDIKNSLSILNPGGVIVCHDMLPPTENHQIVPRMQGQWNGDCWKAWVKVKSEFDDLLMYVIDSDWGVGIIQNKLGESKIKVNEELTFENFIKNKKYWLNLITLDQFKSKV